MPVIRLPTRLAAGVAGLALLAALLAGCGSSSAAGGAAGRLPVVATTSQVADFTRVLGGDRVRVAQLLKPNVDPHDYEPTPADIEAVGNAKVLVENGVGLESWLNDAVGAAGFDGIRVDASRGVTIRAGNGDEEERAGDPHIWHNPLNAKIMVADIEHGLARADPANAGYFHTNRIAYDRRLDALDGDIRRQIATIPPTDRKLVTNHDAFGYYLDRYGLTFVGSIIPSFDTAAELSGSNIRKIVAKIRQTGTKAVFSESSLPPRTARTIAAEAGVRVEAGEDSLYGDTLGPAGSAGATYLQMEEHNTRTIVAALR
ncbi:ABC-type metal ion transport system, periplasmic component/surface adhesin [Frankia torreyi]|uniref:ABC-type metal ion transport system, periplasmic component/surface adhesin n=1 Tax=Frankia torreyi TaxID=1856 RepID=A0A0D8BFT0_9ACTN|nr:MULTISPECIES: metal ABC transporter substrate-binding protein [Frankia]KJE23011.1 ABC-type metal ion transport system, periplasmic component/surface adhesin [Frankia torreyi]KQC36037.1 manganese ABC transporter [Frankia sp. ACN1ag]